MTRVPSRHKLEAVTTKHCSIARGYWILAEAIVCWNTMSTKSEISTKS